MCEEWVICVHYLFVNLNGYVYSIGKNDVGQLGDGTVKERTVPTLVKTADGYLENVANISAGTKTSMAVTYDGDAYVWGNNLSSRLGLENEVDASVYTDNQIVDYNIERTLEHISFHKEENENKTLHSVFDESINITDLFVYSFLNLLKRWKPKLS